MFWEKCIWNTLLYIIFIANFYKKHENVLFVKYKGLQLKLHFQKAIKKESLISKTWYFIWVFVKQWEYVLQKKFESWPTDGAVLLMKC